MGGRVGLGGRRPDPGLLVPDASRQEAEANFSGDTLKLGTPWGWALRALQGLSGDMPVGTAGHSRVSLGYFGVGHSRDTLGWHTGDGRGVDWARGGV